MDDVHKDIQILIEELRENTKMTNFLRTELDENTEINKKLYAMLSENNEQTKFLYETKKVDLTGAQMAKNFGLGVFQNIIGNGIYTG